MRDFRSTYLYGTLRSTLPSEISTRPCIRSLCSWHLGIFARPSICLFNSPPIICSFALRFHSSGMSAYVRLLINYFLYILCFFASVCICGTYLSLYLAINESCIFLPNYCTRLSVWVSIVSQGASIAHLSIDHFAPGISISVPLRLGFLLQIGRPSVNSIVCLMSLFIVGCFLCTSAWPVQRSTVFLFHPASIHTLFTFLSVALFVRLSLGI